MNVVLGCLCGGVGWLVGWLVVVGLMMWLVM
jgi:hypothetical protein